MPQGREGKRLRGLFIVKRNRGEGLPMPNLQTGKKGAGRALR